MCSARRRSATTSSIGRDDSSASPAIDRAVERMSTYGKHLLQDRWTGHEYDVMTRLWQAGLSVPYPIAYGDDVFDLQYIGDFEMAAPQLQAARLEPCRTLASALDQLVDGLATMTAEGYRPRRPLGLQPALVARTGSGSSTFPRRSTSPPTSRVSTSSTVTSSTSARGSSGAASTSTPRPSSPRSSPAERRVRADADHECRHLGSGRHHHGRQFGQSLGVRRTLGPCTATAAWATPLPRPHRRGQTAHADVAFLDVGGETSAATRSRSVTTSPCVVRVAAVNRSSRPSAWTSSDDRARREGQEHLAHGRGVHRDLGTGRVVEAQRRRAARTLDDDHLVDRVGCRGSPTRRCRWRVAPARVAPGGSRSVRGPADRARRSRDPGGSARRWAPARRSPQRSAHAADGEPYSA